jgi:pimeloyl-ACP methyl ester carboxylesterase
LARPAQTIDPAVLKRFYAQKPSWHRCRGHKGFECADVTVPLNYLDPDGRTLPIAVNRLRATGRPMGSLLVNPGGPGGSGLDLGFAARSVIDTAVRSKYDIVGFDPRGVGESNGIRCLDDDQLDRFYRTDSSPDTAAEFARLRTQSRRYADQCRIKAGWLLPYLGTASVARDMDIIRSVVGDRQLNYLGFSYGTQLGQVYAGLFPGRTRRMVLDSVVDSALWAGTEWKNSLRALDAEFDLFLANCVRHGCPLGPTEKAAKARLWRLLGQADRVPLRSYDDRSVTDSDIHTATVVIAMEPKLWATGRRAFASALKGDGRTLRSLADAGRGRQADGLYDSSIPANLAVRCLETPEADRKHQATAEHIKAMADRSPLFAEVNSELACSYWGPASIPQHAIKPTDTGPVLLLNNTADPRTPLAWAESVTARFPDAVLVTNSAAGHISYGRGPCVDHAVDSYLVTGKLPVSGLKCHDAGPAY